MKLQIFLVEKCAEHFFVDIGHLKWFESVSKLNLISYLNDAISCQCFAFKDCAFVVTSVSEGA